jgi:Protein of unknown function (DUF2851)
MFYAPAIPFEYEVARRWWTIPVGSQLPLVDGKTLRLVFPGSPGSSHGPDVRDAVLCTVPLLTPAHVASAVPDEDVQRLIGDVEFHIHASDWWAHGHENDPRYNHVILHVVLVYNDSRPTRRQDGTSIPVCSLNDLSLSATWTNRFSEDEYSWPCQRLLSQLSHEEIDRLLLHAGLQRFEQKAQAFVVQLRATVPAGPYHLYDSCLIPSLAEGLAYGRDRELFRALGLRLLDQHTPLPEPLGHTEQPAPLDASRLRALAHMLERWHVPGIWLTLRSILLSASERDVALNIIHSALRTLFCDLGLSLDRADILICNVVFPFAAAIALLEQDTRLAERAQQLYLSHPGLSSNRVTRMMSTQLQLERMPRGSCRQQGLHYVYQQTCRAKLCNLCLLGKQDV